MIKWIILFNSCSIKNFTHSIHYNSIASICYDDADIIKSKTKDNDKIFLITQGDNCSKVYKITYLTLPRFFNRFDYSLGEPYDKADVFTQNITSKDWQTELANWDYLYLQTVDKQFISKYSGVFKSQAKIGNKQLYKITKNIHNNIVLNLVN